MASPIKGGWTERHDELAKAEGRESWVAWIAEMERERGRAVCGAIAKPRGKPKHPCGNVPTPNGRCKRFHGGKAPRGVQHYKFSSGAGSAYVPKAFAAARGNGAPLSPTSVAAHIELLDAAIEYLCRAMDDPTAHAGWSPAIGRAARGIIRALAEADAAGLAASGNALRAATPEGELLRELWGLVLATLEQRRKHTETEIRAQRVSEDVVPREKAVEFAVSFALRVRWAVGKHVTDDSQASAVLGAVQAALEEQVRPPPLPVASSNEGEA
ncbi:MAG: hypothetical protein ACE5I3_15850 [Phycisphaerae bacterium]